MTLYRNTVSLKAGLFALGIAMVAALLWYSQTLVKELETSERKLLDIYAHLIGKVASEAGGENLGFVFEEVIRQIQFPVVITSPEGAAVSWRNVEVDPDLSPEDRQAYLARLIRRMDRDHTPVDIRYEDLVISKIHYGNSSAVVAVPADHRGGAVYSGGVCRLHHDQKQREAIHLDRHGPGNGPPTGHAGFLLNGLDSALAGQVAATPGGPG